MSAGSFSINSGSTGIVEKQSRVPVDFGLHQNYPNPFNPSTAIRYQIPIQTHVSLIVYDMLGREVSILVDAMQDPGYKTMQFDAGSLASGMYFYRLKTDSFVQTRKLLLLK
ncbi:T9SS C-terminal target domain-containing protein [bacterium]|nr:MAG: T9SS C-terminal target domain-containing protein [bacterium]